MASANDVKRVTGFSIGGVSPIGLKNNSYEKQGGKNILNEFNALFDMQLYKHVFLKNLNLQTMNHKNKSLI